MKKIDNRVKIRPFKDMNKPILFLTLFYAILGAFFILDASNISSVIADNTTFYYYFVRQLEVIGFSLLISLGIIFIHTKRYFLISTVLSVALIVVLLYLLLQSSIDTSVNEVKLTLGNGSFQVAEPLKILLVMFISSFLGVWANNKNHNWKQLLIPILLSAASVVIVFLGGDLGSAAVMGVLYVLVFMSLPSKEMYIFGLKIGVGVILVLGLLFFKFGYKVIPQSVMENSYRWGRFNYVNPCDRPEDVSGYQVCNGYIAIDNGGLEGSGIGNSIQKYMYLPASHTDFIFPIIVEELGVIKSILILLGYIVIIFLIFNVAKKSKNLQNSMLAYGIAIYFMLHIFVNLGGVLGVIPLTGVPLPFLSYGGSFCLTIICSFAVLQRINIENEYEKRKKLLESGV